MLKFETSLTGLTLDQKERHALEALNCIYPVCHYSVTNVAWRDTMYALRTLLHGETADLIVVEQCALMVHDRVLRLEGPGHYSCATILPSLLEAEKRLETAIRVLHDAVCLKIEQNHVSVDEDDRDDLQF